MVNHKVYIGQSKNIELRWKHHKTTKDKHSIHYAFDKYGIENFSFEILEECPTSKLDEKEIYWIKYYDSYKNGYNKTLGGHAGGYSDSLSLEDVEKITVLLKQGELSNQEIGMVFNVSENTISAINTGYYWKRDNIDYPIKKFFFTKVSGKLVKAPIVITKQKNYCIDCGKEISSNSKRCVKCSNINSRKVERPSKEVLYKQLLEYSGNFTALGNKYGVTDNAVRRWCKYYNLPHHSKDYKSQKEQKETQPVIAYKVAQIDKNTGNIIAIYNSIKDAERETGISHISQASNPDSDRKSAGGYYWKRVDSYEFKK